jgi:hypothetical protein
MTFRLFTPILQPEQGLCGGRCAEASLPKEARPGPANRGRGPAWEGAKRLTLQNLGPSRLPALKIAA